MGDEGKNVITAHCSFFERLAKKAFDETKVFQWDSLVSKAKFVCHTMSPRGKKENHVQFPHLVYHLDDIIGCKMEQFKENISEEPYCMLIYCNVTEFMSDCSFERISF